MSDTAETDFVYENAIISAATGDFLPIVTAMLKQAKKLERERDEAREEAERLRESLRCLLNPQCEAEESK